MGGPKGKIIVICGLRADGTLRTVELTDSDELKVALATATGSDLLTELEAKLETADLEIVTSILSVGHHGWIGGALQKQPMIRGYSTDKTQTDGIDPAALGTNTITLDTVPEGEIWDVQFINGINLTTDITDIQFIGRINGISITMQFDTSPSKDYDTMWSGLVTLSYGDGIRVVFHGCLADDVLYARFHAVVTEIDQ